MALTIVNEQYPPRKPKLTLTADSLDELPTEGVAEGSTATVGGTEYSYDSNAGWIEPGSGGGGSDGGITWETTFNGPVTLTKTEYGEYIGEFQGCPIDPTTFFRVTVGGYTPILCVPQVENEYETQAYAVGQINSGGTSYIGRVSLAANTSDELTRVSFFTYSEDSPTEDSATTTVKIEKMII